MESENVHLVIKCLGIKKSIPKFINGREFATQIPTINRALNHFSAKNDNKIVYSEPTSLSGISCYLLWKKDQIFGTSFKPPKLTKEEWKDAMFFAVYMGDEEAFFSDESIFPPLSFFGEIVFDLPLEMLSIFVERYFTDCFYREKKTYFIKERVKKAALLNIESKFNFDIMCRSSTKVITNKNLECSINDIRNVFETILSITGEEKMIRMMLLLPFSDKRIYLDYVHPEISFTESFEADQKSYDCKDEVETAIMNCTSNEDIDILVEKVILWNLVGRDTRERCFEAFYDECKVETTVCEHPYEDWTYFFSANRQFALWIWEHVPREEIASITNSSSTRRNQIMKLSTTDFEKFVQRSKPKLSPESDAKIKELRQKIMDNMCTPAGRNVIPALEKAIEDRKSQLKKEHAKQDVKLRTSTGTRTRIKRGVIVL